MENVYPVYREQADEMKLAPSPEFRKQVGKVTGSIIFFLVVCLLLALAAAAPVVACFYVGVAIIIARVFRRDYEIN